MADANLTTDDFLKSELLRLDVLLRRKQEWWEHPRNAAVLLGVLVALIAAIAGTLGYKIGTTPPAPIVVQFGDKPLQVQIAPEKP